MSENTLLRASPCSSCLRGESGEAGLTLLEVVLALLLFSMMCMLLLSGQAQASQAVLRAQVEREMAELLRLRIDLVALEVEEYRDGLVDGEFPSNISDRILDESKVLGDWAKDYRWEVEVQELIGAGAQGSVEIEGGEQHETLFAEEGSSTAETEDGEPSLVQPDEVDRMLFIRVTIFPPEYIEPSTEEDMDVALRPHTAWTAVHLPAEQAEEEDAR